MKTKFARRLILLAFLCLPGFAFGTTSQWTAWGDSLTGGNATAWPAQLSLLTGLTMNVRGVGGQTSTQIKDRFLAESARWGDFTIIWCGRNNWADPTTVKADIATMVSHLTTSNYFVLGVTNGEVASEWIGTPGYAVLTGLDADLATIYGSHFIDIRKILVNSYNPSLPQDVIDFANDTLPTSLRGDAIHINDAGHLIVANTINAAYLPSAPYTPDTKWTAGTTGTWNTPASWTNGLPAGTAVNSALVPVAGNAILLASSSTYIVTLNVPATTNDLTLYSLLGSNGTVTTLNINSALTTTGINQTGIPAGRLVMSGNPLINVNSGGSVSLGAQAFIQGGTLNVNSGASFVWGNTCSNQGFTIIGSTVNIYGSLAGTTGGWKGNQGLSIESGGGTSIMNINGGSASVDAVTLLYNCGNGTLNILNGGSLTIRNNTSANGITLGDITNGSASAYANVSSLNLSSGTLTNGTNGLLKISYETLASNAASAASVNVSGGTFRQFATTYIGSGRNGSLNVSGSGTFTSAGDILVGGTADQISSAPSGGTTSGVLAVSGGSLTAAAIKIGDGSFGVFGGTYTAWNSPGILNLSGGTLTAASLTSISTNGTINFTGGTLNTAATTVANGSAFQVGNGTNAAALTLNGGSHSFANGLTVAHNGTLSGTGAITGNASLFGTYGAHINSSGTPSADLITVTGSLSLLSGATLQLTDRAVTPVLLSPGTTLTLLSSSGPLTGTFTGLSEGATFKSGTNTFAIHYNATSVTLQSMATYAIWASSNGISGQPSSGSFTHDGLTNGLKYALGLNPTRSSGTPGSMAGNVLTFTKGTAATANGDVTYVIEQSEDLVTWTPVVTQTPPNASATITYTLPSGKSKVFVRLRAIIQ